MELENKKLKEENVKLESHIYNFDNLSESRHKFGAATGLKVESFNNLLKFLYPGKDSCNIKFMILQADYHKVMMISEVQSQIQSQNCHLKITCSCI